MLPVSFYFFFTFFACFFVFFKIKKKKKMLRMNFRTFFLQNELKLKFNAEGKFVPLHSFYCIWFFENLLFVKNRNFVTE